MALLSTTTSKRRLLYACGALTSFLFGCAILQQILPHEKPFGFNHKIHVVGEEMDCSDCHTQVEDSDEPGIPPQIGCMMCHADIDADKDPSRRIDQLFEDGKLKGARVTELGPEVHFSHLLHVEANDCADCHASVENSEYPGEIQPVTMAACIDCHAAKSKPNECSTCHSEINQEWAPESHQRNWTRRHGEVQRAEPGGSANDCSLCHKESACIQCHQQEAPASHNNFWRHRAHGLMAQMDRARCTTCHRTDFCDRCHEQQAPMNHKGSFGGTKSNHCVSCHLPLGSSSCATCHKGTPSHLLATPLPPGHTPGLDCRSCHPGVAPLPHADKGDSCVLCHM